MFFLPFCFIVGDGGCKALTHHFYIDTHFWMGRANYSNTLLRCAVVCPPLPAPLSPTSQAKNNNAPSKVIGTTSKPPHDGEW